MRQRPRKSRRERRIRIVAERAFKPMPALVYDLRQPNGSSDHFYIEISAFSDRVLDEIDLRAGSVLRAYAQYVQNELQEPPRSPGDYSIELLTLGLALRRYARAAERTPARAVRLATSLYELRIKWPGIKPFADLLRARIVRSQLMPGIVHAPLPCPKSETCERAKPCSKSRRNERLCRRFRSAADQFGPPAPAPAIDASRSLSHLPALIAWLRATGEFEQEAARIANWHSFLSTLPASDAARVLDTASALFDWFQIEADRVLGSYTNGVPAFLAGPYAARGSREDQLFCGREPAEYHLGMVAAEVMNRSLRPDFERTRRRVVLVPACMRGQHASTCRARTSGPESNIDITCTSCDPACAVNRITSRMSSLGVQVYLVHHATGFSRWLDRWQAMPEVGVTAVACMLNILPGGYEMRARGIPSQCIPLDYPGCQKHWCTPGLPTGVNEDRMAGLVQIAAAPAGN